MNPSSIEKQTRTGCKYEKRTEPSVLRRPWACHIQDCTSCRFSNVSEILTDGIQGQSPVHFSLPTSQINTSLVFSAVWPQHQLPLPTPGLHGAEAISTG